jgi:hypothetical protein
VSKYEIGTKLLLKNHCVEGVVIHPDELPTHKIYCNGDVCVKWTPGYHNEFITTYNDWWLDENCEIIGETND